MSERDTALWGSRTAGRALAHLPAGHRHTMDYSAWAEVLTEAAAQGHDLRPLPRSEEGATMYVACQVCGAARWRVQRLAVCRAYAALARSCPQGHRGDGDD